MATEEQVDMASKLQAEGIRSSDSISPGSSLSTTMAEAQLQSRNRHWTRMAFLPYLMLTLVQIFFAGHQTLSRVALASGMNQFFFTFYRNLIAFVFLAPAAYYLERDVRPKLTLAIIARLNMLAFFGILGNQQLFLVGLALTSSLYTAVSQNLIPVITFLLAALIGMEKVSFREMSGCAKICGTLVCISGAITMSLYKGAVIYTGEAGQDAAAGFVHLFKDMGIPARMDLKISYFPLGVLCLLLNCTSWGVYLVNQGTVLQKYPALLSMATLVELFGSIQVAIVGAAIEGTSFLDFRQVMKHPIIIFYEGIVASAVNLVLQAWAVEQLGAFLVALFTPIQTLVVALLAILVLGDTLCLGVVIGSIFIIGGFYTVVYGQQMERWERNALVLKSNTAAGEATIYSKTKQYDLEEPLLS